MLNSGNYYRDLLNDATTTTNTLILSANDPNSMPYIDSAQVLRDRVLLDGEIMIGSSGDAPQKGTLTGSTNIIVTNGSGTIALDTIQNIDTSASVTFYRVDAEHLVYAPTVAASDHMNTPYINVQNTSNQIVFTQSSGYPTIISCPPASSPSTYTIPDVGTSADFVMTSGNQTINGVKTLGSAPIVTPLTATRLTSTDSSKALQSVTITNANGCNTSFSGSTLAISMNQDLSSTGFPTFSNIRNTSLPVRNIVQVGPTQELVGCGDSNDGYIPIGAVGGYYSAGTITPAGNLIVTNGPNSITIGDSATPTYTNITATALTATALVATNGSKELQSVTIANSNGCNSSFSGSTLTNSMTQDLSATGTPSFDRLSLTNATNQLTLRSTNTATITAEPQTINTTLTIPNQYNATSEFVMARGDQVIYDEKSFFYTTRFRGASIELQPASFAISIIANPPTDLRQYYLPDVGTFSANFVMSEGTQTINAITTFSSAVKVTPTTNQLVLGTTRTVTITAPTPATSSRTHTIPDITANGTFAFLEGTQTFTGSKLFGSNLLASSDATVDLGSTSTRWRNLYLARNSGLIYLGQGIRTANRAELFMNANGDNVSEIFFGRDTRTDANIKWDFSARASGESNDFVIYRGPNLTSASFEATARISGTTSQWNFPMTTDSSSSTTGAVICAGGVGIAKKLYVGTAIYLPTSGGTASALNYYEEFTHTTSWNGAFSPSSVSGDITLTRVGRMVTAQFPVITGDCTSTNPLWMVTNIPARFRPPSDLWIQSAIVQTAIATLTTGTFYISSTGNWQIYLGINSSFDSTGSPKVGLAYACSVSYSV